MRRSARTDLRKGSCTASPGVRGRQVRKDARAVEWLDGPSCVEHQYFVRQFGPDLADNRPVGVDTPREHNDLVGNNSVVSVKRHLPVPETGPREGSPLPL